MFRENIAVAQTRYFGASAFAPIDKDIEAIILLIIRRVISAIPITIRRESGCGNSSGTMIYAPYIKVIGSRLIPRKSMLITIKIKLPIFVEIWLAYSHSKRAKRDPSPIARAIKP